jgi:hypothetical protein
LVHLAHSPKTEQVPSQTVPLWEMTFGSRAQIFHKLHILLWQLGGHAWISKMVPTAANSPCELL